MGFKKDINQLKKTGKMIKEKAPLAVETSKSVFVIVKWIVILFIVIVAGFVIYTFAFFYPAEKKAEEERKLMAGKQAICQEECKIPESEIPIPSTTMFPEIYKKVHSTDEQCFQECLEREGVK